MSSATKQRLHDLDIFRCIAILAVITIHTTSFPLTNLPHESMFYPLYFILNRFCAFAVPSFLFLSAVVLFYNYENKSEAKGGWPRFFKNRLLYILIPYLVWSLFYFLVIKLSASAPLNFHSLADFGKKLLFGKNYSHLYYIVVIVQFYILFPFLLTAARTGWIRRHLVGWGILLQAVFLVLNKELLHLHSTGSVVFTYLLVIFLGAYTGLNVQKVRNALNDKKKWLFAGWLIAGAAFIIQEWMFFSHPETNTYFTRYFGTLFYYSYMFTSCLICFWMSERIYRFNWKPIAWLSSWGAASFAIYLAHPYVLLKWRELAGQTGHPLLFQIFVLIGGLLALLIPWGVWLLTRKVKLAWVVFGRS